MRNELTDKVKVEEEGMVLNIEYWVTSDDEGDDYTRGKYGIEIIQKDEKTGEQKAAYAKNIFKNKNDAEMFSKKLADNFATVIGFSDIVEDMIKEDAYKYIENHYCDTAGQ